MKKLSQAIVLAGAMTAGLVGVQTAQAEVSASVAIANTYIFRGVDMGAGAAVVSGSLNYAHESGAYAGVWATSGDTAWGDEYNYFVGFGGEAGEFTYDINYLNYYYPYTKNDAIGAGVEVVDIDDWAEVTASLGYKGGRLSATVPTTDDVAGQYVYYTAAYGVSSFGAKLGVMDHDDEGSGYSHVDLSYQFNDNVSFVVSDIVDADAGYFAKDQATLFQVNYSLPISM